MEQGFIVRLVNVYVAARQSVGGSMLFYASEQKKGVSEKKVSF